MGNHNLVTHARRKQSRNKVGINSKNTLTLASLRMGQNGFEAFLIRKYISFFYFYVHYFYEISCQMDKRRLLK